MGHGIVNMIGDYLRETDDLDELYDNNQELFDNMFDNEEDSVEEFAWSMYDNQLGNSGLYKVIQLYLNWCKQNNLNENKIGGLNYGNSGEIRPRINRKVSFEKYIIKRKKPQQYFVESLTDKIFEKLMLLLN